MAWKCFVVGRGPRVREYAQPLEREPHNDIQGASTNVTSMPPQGLWGTLDQSAVPPLGTRITPVPLLFYPSTSRPSSPFRPPVLPSLPPPLARTPSVPSPKEFTRKIRTSSSFDELTRSLPPPPRRRPSQQQRGEKKGRPSGSVKRPGRETPPTISLSIPHSRRNESYSVHTSLSAHLQQSRTDGSS